MTHVYFRAKHFIVLLLSSALITLHIYRGIISRQLQEMLTYGTETYSYNASLVPENYTLDPAVGVLVRDLYSPGHLYSPRICPDGGETIKLVIIVPSAPSNQEARKAIRSTWGRKRIRDIAIAFLIGEVEQAIDEAISVEGTIYSDIIRGSFIDSYDNLTLKSISMLEWVDKHCQKALFILKADDDVFINVQNLMNFIDKNRSAKRKIFGHLAKHWRPIRDEASKYYLSREQFNPVVFPNFIAGPSYLMTRDCVSDLYHRALKLTFLRLEDVFLTGIVAEEENIERINVVGFNNYQMSLNDFEIKNSVSLHPLTPNQQIASWLVLNQNYSNG